MMEPSMVSMDTATDNSYDNLSSKDTHGVVKNPNAILEIEFQNLNAKRIQASKDLQVNEQMIGIYKKQMFILGQRMVQKHSDVVRSRAVVAELVQLTQRLKSRMNANAWIEKVRAEDTIIEEVNGSTDSDGEYVSVEPIDENSLVTEPIDQPVVDSEPQQDQPHNARLDGSRSR